MVVGAVALLAEGGLGVLEELPDVGCLPRGAGEQGDGVRHGLAGIAGVVVNVERRQGRLQAAAQLLERLREQVADALEVAEDPVGGRCGDGVAVIAVPAWRSRASRSRSETIRARAAASRRLSRSAACARRFACAATAACRAARRIDWALVFVSAMGSLLVW